MASIIGDLYHKGLLNCPKFLPANCQFETIMGSEAYMCSTNKSDKDIVGFCIPPKEILFPHLGGYIRGFEQAPNFESWQQHHILDEGLTTSEDKLPEKTIINYDLTIYNITTYFKLCADGNPNMIDSLFTLPKFVIKLSPIGEMVRSNRQLFLSQKIANPFKGYAHSQLMKINTERNYQNESRQADQEKYGYSLKYAYHLIRLLLECRNLLGFGDISWECNSGLLIQIREGNFTKDEILSMSDGYIRDIEVMKEATPLPAKPDNGKLKQLLINCLEHHYGSLSGLLASKSDDSIKLEKIRQVLEGKS